ncbi:transporter substrate-binding domain-containing protein [Pollutimonas sp. M17]|uniref:transporter substrate-binding domain-containing protein n=1 Tax=Pollutimonas sp. M17 TaxID=2962065 RepID=UPI0021F41007|nr:transporter substrate-binding domain-containing protein [Pollutimonas sp. M17]UYO95219.1 transporter substrate-binding domain-containing protein [Pollutimonas sp. M17]
MNTGSRGSVSGSACWFAALLLGAGSAWGASAASAADQGGAAKSLVVGMHYVVPPFVGGSKVRTPEAIDTALAEDLAAKLDADLRTVPMAVPGSGNQAGRLALKADVALAAIGPGQVPPPSFTAVPTGYTARPMAIMRTDTDIKAWDQLKGRTVCLSEGGLYVGDMARRYGAIEIIFKAPADSLLALRTGGCDAAVHDDVMLKELLKLPEWKKFSASLPPGPAAPLAFIVPEDDAATVSLLKKLVLEWKRKKHLADLTRTRVRDIAFEVYLDQVVADCH